MADLIDQPADKRDAKQRIRIGLTGLAGVLVLVLLAAAMLGLRSADPNGVAARGNGSATAHEAKDPLAELGVIPGGNTEPMPAAVPSANAPAAPPAATPAPLPANGPPRALPAPGRTAPMPPAAAPAR